MGKFITRFSFWVPLLCAFLLAPLSVSVKADTSTFTTAKHSQARIIFDRNYIQPSESASVGTIGIFLTLEPGWHTYWEYSGEAAKPPTIKWFLPDGFALGTPNWAVPVKIKERGSISVYGYEKETLISWPVELANLDYLGDKQSAQATIKARLNLLVCKDTCVPEQHDLHLDLTVSTSKAIGESVDTPIFKRFNEQFPTALPSEARITTSGDGYIIDVSSFLRDITDPAKVRANLQLFPKPTLPSVKIEAARLNTIALPTERRSSYAVFQPFPADKSIALGGVLALSKEITKSGREMIYELPPISPITNSKESSTKAGVDLGELTYRTTGNAPRIATVVPASPGEFGIYMLLLAFVGGLILNLMPCVLPVLSIKVFSIVECVRHRHKLLPNSLAYTAGVVSSFGALALLVAALKAAGHSVGWGFQFQNLYFLYVMVGAVFIFSLSLLGGYGFTSPLSNELNDQCNRTKHPLVRSFLEGVLATLLSTPCSAPIVATVLAFALTSSLQYSLPVFLTMGLGLASPLLILSITPSFARLIPKPGMWMIRFRQFLAIILMGTVVWLLDVIQSINVEAVPYALYLLFVLSVLAWLFVSTNRPIRIAYLGLALIAVLYFSGKAEKLSPTSKSDTVESNPSQISWLKYDPHTISSALETNQPVFIVFTAAWCITCKYNERFVINTPSVIDALKETKSIAVRADWTDGYDEITSAIKSYGAEGVPLYVVLHRAKDPIVLSTLPSKQEITDALKSK